MKLSNKALKLCLENMKKSPQAPKVAINSKERIKYIYVIKLGSLQNKRQSQQQALLREYSGEKNQAKTMKGNSNGTRFQ
ncbi:hypothetical protein VN1239_12890 [Helicobacter pylori]|nr:hypothetical protein VN1212_14050 [Helicobacter pylori]GHQ90664.1 hypothetical protein VN1239_12890 [Helicobacter pylori]GHR44364.1 hypothetical protein VN1261_13850 [Helicobacter pylori]